MADIFINKKSQEQSIDANQFMLIQLQQYRKWIQKKFWLSFSRAADKLHEYKSPGPKSSARYSNRLLLSRLMRDNVLFRSKYIKQALRFLRI